MEKLFKKLIDNNQLAHGYLFYGESEKARNNFVEKIVGFLEEDSKFFFDTFIIEPVNGSIGIDRVREIKHFLWQKPIGSANKRSVIIKKAELLTKEAQNAILKVAEEPPDYALLMLLARDHNNLMGTLVSRFQKIYINSQDESRVFNLSIKQYVADFLKGPAKLKREVIKNVLEQEDALSDFVSLLMLELNRYPVRNWRSLKELSHRWRLINQYNVNKRLQLEVVAKLLNG